MSHLPTATDLELLVSFLRGETCAVEVYDQALEVVEGDDARSILRASRASHARRVDILRDEIRRLGGPLDVREGAWGAFARALEPARAVFGSSLEVSILEEGEDLGLTEYRRGLDRLSAPVRTLVERELLLEQVLTRAALARL